MNEIGVDLYKGRSRTEKLTGGWQRYETSLLPKLLASSNGTKKELAAQQAQTAALQAQAADVQSRIDERNDEMAARAEDQRREKAQMIWNFLQANRVQIPMPSYPA